VGEVVAAVEQAKNRGLRVRMVGAGHSFTDVALTDGILLDPALLYGTAAIDADAMTVTVSAGTTLHDLNLQLENAGYALTNMGDGSGQTAAGAISTGTHGTGRASASLSAQVRALELVLADGTVSTCSPTDHPDLFRAAAVGLGAFGIIVAITFGIEPAFLLTAREEPMPLDTVLEKFDALAADNEHFEFFWLPHTHQALTKCNNRSPGPAQPLSRARAWLDDDLRSNAAFGLLNRVGRAAPRFVPRLNQISSRAMSARTYTDASHTVFASRRELRFVEMEYALPREAAVTALREVRALITASPWRISLPIGVRVAPADDLWLSTAYERDSVYVAVHSFDRTPYGAYFGAVEAIAVAYGGRPHWGKLHNRSAADLACAYPRWDDVQRVRDEVDPDRRFGNAYLARVLGS
jgi:FAD-linked oxidoreductase